MQLRMNGMPARLVQGKHTLQYHAFAQVLPFLSLHAAVMFSANGTWLQRLQSPTTAHLGSLVICCCHRPSSTAAEGKHFLGVGQEQELALVCEERMEDGEPEGDAATSCKAQVGLEGVLNHAASSLSCACSL
jgi:hypothetical protein